MSEAEAARAPRRVLVTGAGGFLAGFICAALRADGWCVVRLLRRAHERADDTVVAEFARLTDARDWLPLLDGIDAVVNAAGILREVRGDRFDVVHEHAPRALAEACRSLGIARFVQVSALGDPADGEFIASKHRFDARLLQVLPRAVVLRPSVVYSAAGSYGGTSLLRAQAATPAVVVLPGHGQWPLQPLAAEDLACVVVRALAVDAGGCYEVGGPQVLTLQDYLRQWRAWLRLPPPRWLRVPAALVSFATRVGDAFGAGPLGAGTWRMLRRGNVCAEGAFARVQHAFGVAPRALADVLDAHPSQQQDRWHAQLYPLLPLLRAGMIALFLLSAWVGFATDAATIEALTRGSLLHSLQPVPLARAAAGLDGVLGVALLVGLRTRAALVAMVALVSGYTVAFGALLPALWLDPLGGLAKNLVVLPALLLLQAAAERR